MGVWVRTCVYGCARWCVGARMDVWVLASVCECACVCEVRERVCGCAHVCVVARACVWVLARVWVRARAGVFPLLIMGYRLHTIPLK